MTLQDTAPVRHGLDYATFAAGLGEMPAWIPDGPALRFAQLLKVTGMGRSKAYEVMKSDPEFPQGIPLFDSDRSPRFWWTEQVLTWMRGREAKFKRQQAVRS
jgi:predicted DNA-binding transcriptional regulator AlpA